MRSRPWRRAQRMYPWFRTPYNLPSLMRSWGWLADYEEMAQYEFPLIGNAFWNDRDIGRLTKIDRGFYARREEMTRSIL